MESHKNTVESVAQRVKHFHELKKPFRLYHGSTNSTRVSERTASNTVDTSSLTNVLAVNTETMSAFSEPNVPLGKLLKETLKYNLVLLVVMEFPTITVGGGFSGSSGESSSFRHGGFEATVESIEIVLPDGSVEYASRTVKPDLFWGAASAFGTLGVVTLVEVRLRPAKKYVELEYYLCRSAQQSVEMLQVETAKDDVDFVDGIVYAMDSTVICIGRMVDDKPKGVKEQRFLKPNENWFYLRAQTVQNQLKGKKGEIVTDYIPLVDYLFRYDRGGFWTARYAFKYFVTPFNRITRRILNRFMHTATMYHAMHKSGMANFYIIQDVGVPYERAAEFQQWLHTDLTGIYPLWLCPLKIRRDDPDSAHGLHAEFAHESTHPTLLNFGIWGPVKGSRQKVVDLNRALEDKVQELGGKKWLYAHTYYTEPEFWANYDGESYHALRKKYGAEHLPSVYDKVKVDVEAERRKEEQEGVKTALKKVWPVRGLYGVYHAWKGKDYLLQKQKAGEVTTEKRTA